MNAHPGPSPRPNRAQPRVRDALWAVGSVTCLSLALGLAAGLWSPGYHEPTSWSLPPQRTTAPSPDEASPQTVMERVVGLTVRGRRVNGLLVSPARPHTALVIVHGSGAAHMRAARDEMIALASHGVAVLGTDKELAGYSALHRDFATLGDDAVEAATWLQRELHLDPTRVGLLGRSEGGWVSLLAAARYPQLRGPIVLDSAPVVTPLEQAAYVMTGEGRAGAPVTRRLVTGLLATGRPVVTYLDTDVRAALPQVTNTVVAVFGASDPTVPVAQAVTRLQAGLPRPPTVLLAPGGHLPPPQAWAGQVAQSLAVAHSARGVWRVGNTPAIVPPATGAPTPPAPSAILDPRCHLGAAILLTLIRRRAQRSPSRTKEPRP